MQNYKLTLCYDGTRYKGWQKQGNTDNTIQAKLEAMLTRLLGQDTELASSGRSDAGVHARCQVCSFKADTDMSCDELLAQIRRYLPEDIGAVSLEHAAPRFHARLSCTEKTYVYRVWNSPEPNVFERRYMYAFADTLDIAAMHNAAQYLTGRHDFTSFCSDKHMKKSAVRDLRSVDIVRDGGEIRFTLTGDGFLYNMVRIIAGTLLEVGAGRLDASQMPVILEARDRSTAGPAAPAHGLILWDVKY